MISTLTTLLLATNLSIAEAKKPVTHRHHKPKKHHIHLTHRHHHYHVAKPIAPKYAKSGREVYFYRGHWVMAHHRHHLMWKWNHNSGKWVIVFRF